jgi:hypothetical protein
VAYGFWVFLSSDVVMFSVLVAIYAVFSAPRRMDPTSDELFNDVIVAIEADSQAGLLQFDAIKSGIRHTVLMASPPVRRFYPIWVIHSSTPSSEIVGDNTPPVPTIRSRRTLRWPIPSSKF